MRYWITESASEVGPLRSRLDSFYNSEIPYSAFEKISQQHPYWDVVIDRIKALSRGTQPGNCKIRVLEFGAGRSGFADALGDLRATVHFTVQDVTNRNLEHLNSSADAVYIGDASRITESFDVIFSTFVWEHVTNPKALLEELLARLAPGGSLFIFSPRYDVVGYVPPALRHLGLLTGLWLSLRLHVHRIATRLPWGKARFFIVPDPALFHAKGWFTDADAVHLVSLHDLRVHIKRMNLQIHNCWPKKNGFKRALFERLMKLSVEIRKC